MNNAICTVLSLMKVKDDKYKDAAIQEHEHLLRENKIKTDVTLELFKAMGYQGKCFVLEEILNELEQLKEDAEFGRKVKFAIYKGHSIYEFGGIIKCEDEDSGVESLDNWHKRETKKQEELFTPFESATGYIEKEKEDK